jgi:hypothetical protein
MADDPERDLIPVKEGVSCERQRNGSTFSLSGEKGNDHFSVVNACINFNIP